MPATGRYWPLKSGNTRIAEEEISFTRLRERCDVMANRSDREQGQPTSCPRHHSLNNRMGPCSRTPSGPAVSIDCINRPDRRLHPANATAPIYLSQCGSHPQRTRTLTIGAAAMGHVWTVPAVQEESDVLRSVRVQPCIRPVFAWRTTSVAMQPQWPLALM
jgi:hypothetical protein